MTQKKLTVAVLGTGNIGTDLLMKILRSPYLDCQLFAGRNLSSPGMTKANSLGVPVSAKGVEGILNSPQKIELVFDATSALDHKKHAVLFAEQQIVAVDLTPAKVGKMCVPAVNLEECVDLPNVNMITCGGQASIPLAFAIGQAIPNLSYIETVSSISSRSAGPATRINLDEYLMTTEAGLSFFTACSRTKAILNLNPAQPCVHMQTSLLAKVDAPDMALVKQKVNEMVAKIKSYVPGYQLIVEPILENGRLICMVRVDGLGDYLPKYAGNLDIINCAAIAFAEAVAKKRGVTA